MIKTIQRKAVSPVIATVILVAVAITVSIGVSYWMSGISSQYTQFEKVEITTGWAEKVTGVSINGWEISLTLKNSGSATATITNIFINDVPVPLAATAPADIDGVVAGMFGSSIEDVGLTLEAGQEDATVKIWIATGGADATFPSYYLSSGTTINVKLHSAGGMDYIKLIQLT